MCRIVSYRRFGTPFVLSARVCLVNQVGREEAVESPFLVESQATREANEKMVLQPPRSSQAEQSKCQTFHIKFSVIVPEFRYLYILGNHFPREVVVMVEERRVEYGSATDVSTDRYRNGCQADAGESGS